MRRSVIGFFTEETDHYSTHLPKDLYQYFNEREILDSKSHLFVSCIDPSKKFEITIEKNKYMPNYPLENICLTFNYFLNGGNRVETLLFSAKKCLLDAHTITKLENKIPVRTFFRDSPFLTEVDLKRKVASILFNFGMCIERENSPVYGVR